MFEKGINEILNNVQKQERATDFYESSVPVLGTLGEQYLVEHRGIPREALAKTNFRYHAATKSLVTPIYDARESLTGVQLINLGEDGNKAFAGNTAKKVIENKATKEQFGRVAMVRKGTDLTKIFIAEGVETAASLLSVIPEEFTVIAALGLKEMPSAIPYIRTNLMPSASVVWLADNDVGEETAMQHFAESKAEFLQEGFKLGKDLFIAAPSTEGHDWNDVLKESGTSGVKDAFEASEIAMEKEYSLLDTPKLLGRVQYETDERETLEKSFAHAKIVRNHILKLEGIWYKAEEFKFLLKEFTKINNELERLKQSTFRNADALLNAEKKLQNLNKIILGLHKHLIPTTDLTFERGSKTSNDELTHAIAAKNKEQLLLSNAIDEISLLNPLSLKEDITSLLEGDSAFKNYYARFPKDEQEKCLAGEIPPFKLKALALDIHKEIKNKLSREITEIRNRKLEQDKVNFLARVEDSFKALGVLREKVVDSQKTLEIERVSLVKLLQSDFLASFDPNSYFLFDVALLGWYCNLAHFIYSKIITCPVEDSNKTFLCKVETVVGEEPKIKNTIEVLAKDLLQRSGVAEKLRQRSSSDAEYDLAVRDYAYRLAMNMHYSFKVTFQEDGKSQEQEFDGICKRSFTVDDESGDRRTEERYVIIERKTNIGTGEGLLQTVFTQGKINAKMDFYKRATAPFVAEDILLGNGINPKASDVIAAKLSESDIECMDKTAKAILAEALNARHIEMVFNDPGHDVVAATKMNFFDANCLRKMMLRVSQKNAGDEKEIFNRLTAFYERWLLKCRALESSAVDKQSVASGVSIEDSVVELFEEKTPVVSLESMMTTKQEHDKVSPTRQGMFFDRKRDTLKKDALKLAAKGIVLGAIPGVNVVVGNLAVGMAAIASDSPKSSEELGFCRNLALGVAFCSYLWVPALFIMPFALAYLVMNTVIDKFFSKEEVPSFDYKTYGSV